MSKPGRLRLEREMINAYKILVGIPQGQRQRWTAWKDTERQYLREIWSGDWIEETLDTVQ